MRKLRALALRLLRFLHLYPSSDFADELESHIVLDTEAGIRSGLTPQEARRQALIRLGGAEQAHQAHRNRATLPALESVLQDIRYGLRSLRRSPGFTITAVLTLALGIGACTAIFSLVNAVLIRSLPYGDPARLVYLFTPNARFNLPPDVMSPSYGDLNDIRQQSHSYLSLTAFVQATLSLASQQSVERIGAARVDANFFSTLQSAPAIGRAIDATDTQPGHDKVAVLSHTLWQSLFALNPGVLNSSITLDGVSYRIIGVMPAAFTYPSNLDLPYGIAAIKTTQIWTPLVLTPAQQIDHEPGDNYVIGRLRAEAAVSHAQSEMSTIMARLDPLHDAEMRGWGALVKPFLDNAVGPVRRLMWILLATVCAVLLIACGNAANLLLARASGRMRELGIRVALGAGRRRVIRQLLTESLLLGLGAGALGCGFAALFLRLLPVLDPGNIPRLDQASLDARVLAFTVLVSLLTSLLTGILPALAISRTNLIAFLASGSNSNTGHSRAQSTLIVAETALVVVLLSCAGLLIRSYINVASVQTGFAPSTLTMHLWLDASHRSPQASRAAYCKTLIDKLNSLPGVTAAGAVSNLPLSNSESLTTFSVEGYANRKDQLVQARSITPQYFAAMSIPLIAGRLFTDSDLTGHFAIANQRFAKTYLANRNPIGARVSTDNGHNWDTIVGVIGDVRHTSLEADPEPQLYHPNYDFDSASVAIRASLPPPVVTSEIRTALVSINSGLTLTDIRTMSDFISQASAQRRFQTSLLTVFAAIALLLALVGLYGLMAYAVSRRTREVGIRMALGAQRSAVMLLVLKNAARLLSLGLVSGLACSWIATRAMKAWLFGVSEHDPVTIAIVCLLLAACGLVAALIPARRAASIDPMQALRAD